MKCRMYFLAVIFFGFQAGLAQTNDSIPYDHGFLHYHEYGSKHLPTVILLTGGPGNSYTQLEEMAKTMSQKFRCILPEQRGTGKSIPKPFDSTTISVNLVTEDIKTLMDRLTLKKAIVIGHSWGGTLAMNFAVHYPESVEHLILIAPGPHKDAKRGFEVLAANRTHTRSFEEEERLKQLNTLIEANKAGAEDRIEAQKLARRAYIYANPLPDSLFVKINAVRNTKTETLLVNDLFKEYDVSNSLKKYKGPIDIISGRQDVVGFFSYELKQDIPKANLYWINECGHFPMYEQPARFYKILHSILNTKE